LSKNCAVGKYFRIYVKNARNVIKMPLFLKNS
jgi:hypothetical protein